MKRISYLLAAFAAVLCFNSCDFFPVPDELEVSTVIEPVAKTWDDSFGAQLVTKVYREEVRKAQNGSLDGVLIVLEAQKNTDFAIDQAKAGAAIAKERVLSEGLKMEDGEASTNYRIVAVDNAEESDFVVNIYVTSGNASDLIIQDYYHYTHKSPVKYVQPEAVDLGLDVLWASFNVGATKPEEFGGFYAWGETSVKDEYPAETYRWGDGQTFIKYFNNDEQLSLSPDDDAAVVNLGNGWRTPTKAEVQALIDGCEWKVERIGDVRGCTVKGTNGQSIFIPMAGAKNAKGANANFGAYGNYFTSERCTSTKYFGYAFYLRFHGSGQFIFETSVAEGALPIRAVKDKE